MLINFRKTAIFTLSAATASTLLVSSISMTPQGLSIVFSKAEAKEGCILKAPLSKLQEFDPSRSNLDAVKSELEIRKSILKDILNCAIFDSQDLENNLRKTNISNSQLNNINKQTMERLADNIKFYKTQLALVDNLGIRASQEMAAAVKEWRISNFAPVGIKTIDLILWSKNQALFKAASVRLDQITASIKQLKLEDNEDIKNKLAKAQDSLSQALAANEAAKEPLASWDGHDAFSKNLTSSLELLSQTYDAFFELSNLVQELI